MFIAYLQHNKKNIPAVQAQKKQELELPLHLNNYYTGNCIKIVTWSRMIKNEI